MNSDRRLLPLSHSLMGAVSGLAKVQSDEVEGESPIELDRDYHVVVAFDQASEARSRLDQSDGRDRTFSVARHRPGSHERHLWPEIVECIQSPCQDFYQDDT